MAIGNNSLVGGGWVWPLLIIVLWGRVGVAIVSNSLVGGGWVWPLFPPTYVHSDAQPAGRGGPYPGAPSPPGLSAAPQTTPRQPPERQSWRAHLPVEHSW